ncbi:MAG TPA: MFS transporter, partial [Bacteroidales bacterium]|nr:MFS transporter [Bacteroidales bacterium]
MAKDNQQANSTFLGRFGLNKEILAISFARMSDSIGNGLLIVLLPLYIAQLDVSWLHVSQSIQVGIVLSVFGLITAFAQPLAGALTDRTGRQKEIIIGGLLLMGLSILMLVFVDTYEWLILIRILQGIGLAATIPASITLLTLATEKNRRGQGMGFYTTFRVLGFSIGPLLGGAAHDYLGFQTSFYISMSFVLAGAILV